jgi:UDP-sulfoquinovose synthase
MFACKIWNIKATDLNQGVVYGTETGETKIDPRLATRFDYDQIYGTVLNRFCIQAAIGYPLTVYGQGGQTRSYIHLQDTVKCVELAIDNPPCKGEFRVFNQFTEIFSINQLAKIVSHSSRELNLKVKIRHLNNPRVESEKHYYNAVNTRLMNLGLKPHYLKHTVVTSLMKETLQNKSRVNKKLIGPSVNWRKIRNNFS